MQNIKEFKQHFDPLLEDFLNKRINKIESLITNEFVKQFVEYSKNLIVTGKRLRPYLAYLTYKTYGGNKDEEVLKLFISLEIFHLFALIHDDIMDRALTRRGEKTVHEFVLQKLSGDGDLKHVANSQAILVGDLIVAWALDNFKNASVFDQDCFEKSREYFYMMIDEVILGQMLDVDTMTKERVEEEIINEKTRLKTSRYTCVRPMQIGAFLANKNYNDEKFLEELGTKVGIAFQIQDDLLAIVGEEKTLTKDILIDVEEHQHTFFTNYLFENGSKEQIDEFKGYFGKKLTDVEKEKVKKLFIDSRSIDEGKKTILEMLNDAKKLVENSKIDGSYKKYYTQLIDIIISRQS